MEQASFEQRLTSLWRQGSRDIALAFLRRALTPDNTLAEVLAALQFAGIQDYLSDIRLKDVLGAEEAALLPTVLPPRGKRKRRTAEELDLIRERVLDMVSHAADGMNTAQLCEQLQEEGHELDALRVSLMLKTLKAEGRVVDLGGRPKAWRPASPPRVAEPMLIRKKQFS